MNLDYSDQDLSQFLIRKWFDECSAQTQKTEQRRLASPLAHKQDLCVRWQWSYHPRSKSSKCHENRFPCRNQAWRTTGAASDWSLSQTSRQVELCLAICPGLQINHLSYCQDCLHLPRERSRTVMKVGIHEIRYSDYTKNSMRRSMIPFSTSDQLSQFACLAQVILYRGDYACLLLTANEDISKFWKEKFSFTYTGHQTREWRPEEWWWLGMN
jgi:hypothetical protein